MNDFGLEAVSALVRDSASSGVERSALLLRTDILPPSLAAPSQLHRARRALDPLGLADRSRCHELPDGRVVVSWRGEATLLLRQALDRLGCFLQEDPLDAPDISQLVDFFALPTDGEKLLREAERNAPEEETTLAQIEAQFEVPTALKPLDLAFLQRLEQSLSLADMSSFARRRAVCHASTQGMALAWEERRLSVRELIDTVAPGRDAKTDPWLFRRLTRVMDRRMLSILSKSSELNGAGPFGITLNVSSILSPEFLRFDAALPAALRNRVVIGLQPADIVADTASFAFARNFARGRSYRLCLRSVAAPMLPALHLPALELDYVQLKWSDDFEVMESLPDTGGARWIVGGRCSTAAIEWGRRVGISLFTTSPKR